MLFNDSYFTIAGPSEGIFKDRGSKFLAFAYPVSSEEEVKEKIAALQKLHPSAVHHCYAWRIGPGAEAFRANDDGEPSNTAGKPILAQIQSKDLTNVLVVVVRYFGGTLLGVGGLINAYRSAAADALSNATTEERFILFQYKIEFSFEEMNFVMKALKDNECKILEQNFENVNTILFNIKKQNLDRFENALRNFYKIKLQYIKTL